MVSGERSPITSSAIRALILHESHRAQVGHIGSCLSIADIVTVLFEDVLRDYGTDHPDRDHFLLGKGHAVLTLYAALHLKGILTRDKLASYCADGSLYGSHPDHRAPGIELSTGSLGLALSVGAGMALAARLRQSSSRVFVLLSDAEQNEGSVWETAMFAAHHQLANLIAIVDANGQQALGATQSILDLEPLGDKWRAFGWHVCEVDGHEADALREALSQPAVQRPTLVIARTVFGKGVSFMERQLPWHYYPIDEVALAAALQELVNG